MSYRRETNNKRLWKEMGLELEAVRLLLIGILCDREYQLIMSKAAMRGLNSTLKCLGRFHESADLRMRHVGVEGDLYGLSGDVEEDVKKFRDMIKRKCVIPLRSVNGEEFFNLSDEELEEKLTGRKRG